MTRPKGTPRQAGTYGSKKSHKKVAQESEEIITQVKKRERLTKESTAPAFSYSQSLELFNNIPFSRFEEWVERAIETTKHPIAVRQQLQAADYMDPMWRWYCADVLSKAGAKFPELHLD